MHSLDLRGSVRRYVQVGHFSWSCYYFAAIYVGHWYYGLLVVGTTNCWSQARRTVGRRHDGLLDVDLTDCGRKHDGLLVVNMMEGHLELLDEELLDGHLALLDVELLDRHFAR